MAIVYSPYPLTVRSDLKQSTGGPRLGRWRILGSEAIVGFLKTADVAKNRAEYANRLLPVRPESDLPSTSGGGEVAVVA